MAPTESNPPPHTAADYYGFFLMELSDLIEGTRSARMKPAAIELLRQAQALFRAEFLRRYPSLETTAEEMSAPAAGETVGEPVPWHVLAATIDDALASEADDVGVALLRRAEELFWPRAGS